PQCPTARTRYSPRATPDTGAAGGGVSLAAKVMSQAGRNTLSNMGTVIFFGVFLRLTGGTERRKATRSLRSPSAMPLKDVNGGTGRRRSPLGRGPSRIAVMICSSVQPPIPVALSGVMFVEYTVPNGPSNFLPPALGDPLGSVWQRQPPAAPKMYLPRAISDGSAAKAAPAHQATRQVTRTSRRTAAILTYTSCHGFPLRFAITVGACHHRRRSPALRSRAPRPPPPARVRACGHPPAPPWAPRAAPDHRPARAPRSTGRPPPRSSPARGRRARARRRRG